MSLCSAASARASVTFYVQNNSSFNFSNNWAEGAWDVPGTDYCSQLPCSPPPCLAGAWANYDSHDNFNISPGQFGSIEVTNGSDPCLALINSTLYVSWNTSPPSSLNLGFEGVDPVWPFPASANCYSGSGDIYRYFSIEEDGFTCIYSDATGTIDANFVASSAVLHHRRALIPIGAFAKKKSGGTARGRYELTLRSHGRVIGRRAKSIGVGPTRFRVPVDRSIRKKVAKHMHAKVHAAIRRVDGKPGSGDVERLTLVRRSPVYAAVE